MSIRTVRGGLTVRVVVLLNGTIESPRGAKSAFVDSEPTEDVCVILLLIVERMNL